MVFVLRRRRPSSNIPATRQRNPSSRNRHGGRTLERRGWLDEEGETLLTDRKELMIISAGREHLPAELGETS